MICGPQGNKTTCEVGEVLADTVQHMYQWVYAASMASVVVFGTIKGFTFTKTALMASSSLHDKVFDKVLPTRSGAYPIIQSTGFSEPCYMPGKSSPPGAFSQSVKSLSHV